MAVKVLEAGRSHYRRHYKKRNLDLEEQLYKTKRAKEEFKKELSQYNKSIWKAEEKMREAERKLKQFPDDCEAAEHALRRRQTLASSEVPKYLRPRVYSDEEKAEEMQKREEKVDTTTNEVTKLKDGRSQYIANFKY